MVIPPKWQDVFDQQRKTPKPDTKMKPCWRKDMPACSALGCDGVQTEDIMRVCKSYRTRGDKNE
jgi:hypothetical protein